MIKPLSPPLAANDDAPALPHGKAAHCFAALKERGFAQIIEAEQEALLNNHPLAITPALFDIMDPTDPHDPIARQFVPCLDELTPDNNAIDDPIGDETHNPVAGIIHRYPDRLLLNLIKVCPAYCRFCFRRGKVGSGLLTTEQLATAMNYIRTHKEIWEVILSGGEPLMLSPRRLKDVMVALRAIPHVRTIRIHTRAPITTPEKITNEITDILRDVGKPLNMMIHCNHPRELTQAACNAIQNLQQAGVHLFSQSVLLKGVNDDVDTLTDLMRSFLENGIKPYYLHHPDLVHGTKHFRLPLARGIALVQSLQGNLSGLGQPRYMLEIPGGQGKVNILSPSLRKVEGGWMARNFKGKEFFYKDED